MSRKVLFVATVLRAHVLVFHLPYMKWFQEQGYEVHLCCANDTDEPAPVVPYCDRFMELPFDRSPLSQKNLRAYQQLKRIIDTEQYALIHCNTPTGGLVGRLAARRMRKHGTKVVYTAHGFHFFKGAPLKNNLIYYPVEKWLSRFTDLLITINHEDFEAAQRFHACKTALVSGVGVDLSRFSHPVSRAEVRKKLGIPETSPLLITVGEHSYRKNHETILRALEKLPEQTELLLCGVGDLQQQLEKLAEALSIENRVHFLGFRKDIPDLLMASDVFVFPSRQEGLPVAQMEAMAAGLPCVVSNVRGNRDLLSEGDGGYLADPDDVDTFAVRIAELIKDEKLRSRMGMRNRKVMQRYSLSNVLSEMEALYREQLGGEKNG